MVVEFIKLLMWPAFIFASYLLVRFALNKFDKKRED